jgi:hypothetical protein
MRLALGLLLIVAGLVGGYLVITGKFPPAAPPATGSGGVSSTGQGYMGSGGVSVLGTFTHPAHYNDLSAGRFYH